MKPRTSPRGIEGLARRPERSELRAVEGPGPEAGAARRRVLVFTSVFPSGPEPEHGVFVKERIRHLAALPGYSFRVVSPVPYFPKLRSFPRYYRYSQIPRKESIEGLPVVRPRYLLVPKLSCRFHGHSMYLGSRSAVRRLRAEFPFDLIDGHFVYPDGLAAVLLGKMTGRPVVLTARGSDIRNLGEDPRAKRHVQLALREAQGLVAVSEDLARRMVELGASPEKLRVIPNGVDCGRFQAVEQEEAKRKLRLDSGGPVLVSAGHLLREKGHHLLVRALPLLRQRWPGIRLYLLGGPARGRPDITPDLRREIGEKGLCRQVTLCGRQEHGTMHLWYSAADLFCLMSESEGCPNVVLEALACGAPVIASNVGGVPEIVTSDGLGILVAEQTPEAAARAIARGLEKTWDRAAIRREMAARTWSATAERIDEVFEQAVAEHPRPIPN